MLPLLTDTYALYRAVVGKTATALHRSWIIMVAVVGFGGLLSLAFPLASPLGLVGGVLLSALNGLLVGATLSLIEQVIVAQRTLTLSDIRDSLGDYFWEVIGIGFLLWVPLMALDLSLRTNPWGLPLTYAVLFLLFLLLNAVPEVLYQVRQDSPLDVVKTSVTFILDNWIEWFFPLAVLLLPIFLAPLGVESFFALSSRSGRGGGLDFYQLLILPFSMLGSYLDVLGVSATIRGYLGLLLTPPCTVAMLLFRGHLFAALHGQSRRQRRFHATASRKP